MTIVVDYGMGNLRNVVKAVQTLGHDAVVSGSPDAVEQADRLILPGVGAFGDAARRLETTGLASAVKAAVRRGSPILGICLGMQLLLEESLEFGCHRGLGLLGGRVVPFSADAMDLRIPHMGWNSIEPVPGSFVDNLPSDYMYFVHSFHADGMSAEDAAAYCTYGYPFVCALQRGLVWGAQFHPEKSGRAGLAVLQRFLTVFGHASDGGVDKLCYSTQPSIS